MTVAATGFFDGVHKGHKMVIENACAIAREKGERSLVVTFWPHPRAVLQLDADKLRILSTLEEKRKMCYALGVDEFVVLPFTRDFGKMTAKEFLMEYLVEQFSVSTLVLGYDHHLGSDDERNAEKMAKIVRSCGIEPIRVQESISKGGVAISSTMVRNTLAAGDVETAADCLGYNYSLDGVVVSGNKLGRTIGFPTANMSLCEPLKLIPGNGVYEVCAEVLGKRYPGVCNIGVRPTLDDGRGQTVETHIIGFDEDIYGLPIKVEFLSRIRDERKFPSLEELRKQLEEDCAFVRNSPKVSTFASR